MKIAIAPVTPVNWPDLETLFETPGGPAYCWCMTWRDMPGRALAKPAHRKAALRAEVMAAREVGLLLTAEDVPGGWCSLAPTDHFRPLSKARVESGTWSLTCLFLRRDLRGHGLSARLLTAAIDHARAEGASALEATPVDPDSPSYRFMGFVPLFAAHGFLEVGKAGTRRHVMRLDLRDGGR